LGAGVTNVTEVLSVVDGGAKAQFRNLDSAASARLE
jgi:hypothetical protein